MRNKQFQMMFAVWTPVWIWAILLNVLLLIHPEFKTNQDFRSLGGQISGVLLGFGLAGMMWGECFVNLYLDWKRSI